MIKNACCLHGSGGLLTSPRRPLAPWFGDPIPALVTRHSARQSAPVHSRAGSPRPPPRRRSGAASTQSSAPGSGDVRAEGAVKPRAFPSQNRAGQRAPRRRKCARRGPARHRGKLARVSSFHQSVLLMETHMIRIFLMRICDSNPNDSNHFWMETGLVSVVRAASEREGECEQHRDS